MAQRTLLVPKSVAQGRPGLVPSRLLQRECACRASGDVAGECAECHKNELSLQRRPAGHPESSGVPPIVHAVLRSPGQPLDAETRAFFELRFGHDFREVRVHADGAAAQSAQTVNALAYAAGQDLVFGRGQYAPHTTNGRRLLAHELTHVLQQGLSPSTGGRLTVGSNSSAEERIAERTSDEVLAGRRPGSVPSSMPSILRRVAPFIRKVGVHLTPPQSTDLEWEGTPPADAPGSDHFTVSTGKGYSDPGDPAGTCTRLCCRDPMTQCAPPWNLPDEVGACCTYYGSSFWTGTSLDEHNGWKWWTPIEPHYSSRGIALHGHDTVTGQPIGHGCVRMDEPNAKRIHDFANGRSTNVTIDGRAAPVVCEEARRCHPSATPAGTRGALDEAGGDGRMGISAIPGLEGLMT